MKNSKKSLVIALMGAAMLATAVVSCKKDNQVLPTNSKRNVQPISNFTPPKVDDMNTYLKDFKMRMLESRSDETMGLEEASWYLSSVANYDFGHVNVDYNDIRFDTLYGHVNLTDGKATLQDLGKAYSDIARSIDAFYHSLQIDGKHFRFINVLISENGEVTVSMITTFLNRDLDHVYYYPSIEFADSICHIYYDEYGHYPANGFGRSELQRVLNLIESHSTDPNGRSYYIEMYTEDFYFMDHIDSLGSPFYHNSRLFANIVTNQYELSFDELCYCTDSYLSLGYQYVTLGKDPISWTIFYNKTFTREGQVRNHELLVSYGEMVSGEGNNY